MGRNIGIYKNIEKRGKYRQPQPSHQRVLYDLLATMSGKGRYPWSFIKESWCKKTGLSVDEFNDLLHATKAKYPHRLIITRPYNLSESPMIEVPE